MSKSIAGFTQTHPKLLDALPAASDSASPALPEKTGGGVHFGEAFVHPFAQTEEPCYLKACPRQAIDLRD